MPGQPQGPGKAKHVDMQNLWIQEAEVSQEDESVADDGKTVSHTERVEIV